MRMVKKQSHWTKSWPMPRIPAKQEKEELTEQQAQSSLLVGRERMLAKALLADRVPRRTKYGEMPSDDLCATMR